MNKTSDLQDLPVDLEGSLDPSGLPEITLGSQSLMAATDQTTPMVTKSNSGRISPVRGRTMKEYDQQISDLKKENFSLKMRIYYMEERMQQRYGDGQDVFKTNIELQVEIENLKRELMDKQVLVQKAALAMETLTSKHEKEEEVLKSQLLGDYMKEMSQLREQLDKANKNCVESRKDVENAERNLELLKQQLDDARTELADSNKMKEELTSKVTSCEFDLQTLTAQLKLSEQARMKQDKDNQALTQQLKDLGEQLQDSRRKSSRKDRDIQNLSAILQDQSQIDSTSILEPARIQDELDDQKMAIEKKDATIADLEKQLKDRDSCIGNLEDDLRNMEDKKKEAEKANGELEKNLGKKNVEISRYKKSIDGLVKSLRLKDEEGKKQKKELDEAMDEIKSLQDALKEAELQKSKALNDMAGQLAEADASNRRLKHQLMEANDTSENLVKSLGKREGELAGFQEQLVKALDALNKSEEALENLHGQLKTERAEFDNRLRDQAIHFQISLDNKSEPNSELEGLRQQIVELQKLIASQNVELLALARERDITGDLSNRLKERDTDIELLCSKHKKELSQLERENQSLKSAINSRDIKIQGLESHQVWLEEHQRETVKRIRESSSFPIQELSHDLLQDIKMLMDLLRREISSLAVLQLQLRGSEHGLSSETLAAEIVSIQRIYKQLEKGVEKNCQLHQALVNSLRGELRQSDSPDSNSCQDGGYNVGPTFHHTKYVSLSASPEFRHHASGSPQQRPAKAADKNVVQSGSSSSVESDWESPPASQSVAVETSPEVIDRSQQTGSSFLHTDQWVQTSPYTLGGRVDKGILGDRAGVGDRMDKDLFGNSSSMGNRMDSSLLGDKASVGYRIGNGLLGDRESVGDRMDKDLFGNSSCMGDRMDKGLLGDRANVDDRMDNDLLGDRENVGDRIDKGEDKTDLGVSQDHRTKVRVSQGDRRSMEMSGEGKDADRTVGVSGENRSEWVFEGSRTDDWASGEDRVFKGLARGDRTDERLPRGDRIFEGSTRGDRTDEGLSRGDRIDERLLRGDIIDEGLFVGSRTGDEVFRDGTCELFGGSRLHTTGQCVFQDRSSNSKKQINGCAPFAKGDYPSKNDPHSVGVDIDVNHHYTFGVHNDSLTDDAKEEHFGLYPEDLEDYRSLQRDFIFSDGQNDSQRPSQPYNAKQGSKFEGTAADHDSPVCSYSSKSCSPDWTANNVGAGGISKDVSETDLLIASLNGAGYSGHTSDVDEPDGNSHVPGAGRRLPNKACESVIWHTHDPDIRSGNRSRDLICESLNDGIQLAKKVGDSGDNVMANEVTGTYSSRSVESLQSTVGEEEELGKDARRGREKNPCVGEDLLTDKHRVEEKHGSDVWPGTRVRSRSNSWAEELERYRVRVDDPDEEKCQSRGVGHELQQQLPHGSKVEKPWTRRQKEDVEVMSAAQLRTLVTELQNDLVDAANQNLVLKQQLKAANSSTTDAGADVDVEELQEKLAATENTVRVLSKKNKSYLIALQAAGVSVSLLNRSSSDNCLASLSGSVSNRTSSVGNLSAWITGDTAESVEKARRHYPDALSQSDRRSFISLPTSLVDTQTLPDLTVRDTETSSLAASDVGKLSQSKHKKSHLPVRVDNSHDSLLSNRDASVTVSCVKTAGGSHSKDLKTSSLIDTSHDTASPGAQNRNQSYNPNFHEDINEDHSYLSPSKDNDRDQSYKSDRENNLGYKSPIKDSNQSQSNKSVNENNQSLGYKSLSKGSSREQNYKSDMAHNQDFGYKSPNKNWHQDQGYKPLNDWSQNQSHKSPNKDNRQSQNYKSPNKDSTQDHSCKSPNKDRSQDYSYKSPNKDRYQDPSYKPLNDSSSQDHSYKSPNKDLYQDHSYKSPNKDSHQDHSYRFPNKDSRQDYSYKPPNKDSRQDYSYKPPNKDRYQDHSYKSPNKDRYQDQWYKPHNVNSHQDHSYKPNTDSTGQTYISPNKNCSASPNCKSPNKDNYQDLSYKPHNDCSIDHSYKPNADIKSQTYKSPNKDSSTDPNYKSPHASSGQGGRSPGKQVSFSLDSQSNRRSYVDSSTLDCSSYPDVTYTSILDGTLVNRLFSNLEHNMSALREEAGSGASLSVEQLQARLDHLERVNQTLREEIGLYEALHRSQGTQVSPSLSEDLGLESGSGGGQERAVTEEDLLRQHLIEIRKLRQRLEKLDVTKDPEQLLIFQSHTQQRITRQETMIAQLQQQMVEKEEEWHREMMELQHKLSREKALLVEKLELTVSDLQGKIRNQASKIGDLEKQVLDLSSELNMKEDSERRKEEDIKRLVFEKMKLETDLLNKEKEFLDVEKRVFKLEMMKEGSDSECRRLSGEVREKERENERLRQQVEESRESSRSFKETIVRCEKLSQDRLITVQKLTNEKAAGDQKLVEKERLVKKLEVEIGSLKREVISLKESLEERVGLRTEIDRLREELKMRDGLQTKYEFQKVSYETEIKRITEEMTTMRTQMECENEEREELRQRITDMEQKLKGKASLENQIVILKGEIEAMAGLQDKIDRLNAELNAKTDIEIELRSRLEAMGGLQAEVDVLREKLVSSEEGARVADHARKSLMEELKEKEEKVKKRDKQLHHLIGQYKKLDAAFTKQKYLVNEKMELVQSLKKQMHLYEVTLTCESKEEKDNIMKQLLKELIATQRQVEDLLSRLEQNSAGIKTLSVPVESYGFSMTSSSSTSVVTTTTVTTGSSNSHHEQLDTSRVRLRDDIMEFDEMDHDTSELEKVSHSHSPLSPVPTNHKSPHRSAQANQISSPGRYLGLMKSFASGDHTAPEGTFPHSFIGSDIRSLFAVLKLDAHEKLRKETGEGLVILSGIEARLGNRLKMYKSKSVTERVRSLEYSTLRESSMSCKNLRVCLEEASRLIASAWVTELPPIDARGHFYDPLLAEHNKTLQQELAHLHSQFDLSDRSSLKDQRGRLNLSRDNTTAPTIWESSLYKQLHKTTQDLEQAKENIDTSLASLPLPFGHQSFCLYSSQKSPRRRLEDTL